MSEVTLPDDISIGAEFEEENFVQAVRTVNAFEQRNRNWDEWLVNGTIAFRNKEALETTKDMLTAAGGKFESFRMRNYSRYRTNDLTSSTNNRQSLGTFASGQTTQQLRITITFGALSRQRDIRKPRDNAAFKFYWDDVERTEGADYSVDYATGIVTFLTTPGVGDSLEWEGEWDEHVRMEEDIYAVIVSIVFLNGEKVESIQPMRLIGVRGE